jgi:hypothetical protein
VHKEQLSPTCSSRHCVLSLNQERVSLASSSSIHYATSQPCHLAPSTVMHRVYPKSTSSFESDYVDNTSTRQSSLDTPPSSNPQSSSSSVRSCSHSLPDRPKRSSLKSGLKTSKSASSLRVRFEVPELPQMPQLQPGAHFYSQKNGSIQPAKFEKGATVDFTVQSHAKAALRPKSSKRFSTPDPLSKKETRRTSQRPFPQHLRNFSTPTSTTDYRATSFRSVASAPAVLVSTPLSPSQPPFQYNPLQHHTPCIKDNCTKTYTASLLGPTFYSPQEPYQLMRKRALCPWHANQELNLANHKAKCTWESMRQNAGRKTLGLVAAEFEIYIQQCREERQVDSEELEARQKRILLGDRYTSGKETVSECWDWKYTPRPCTTKGCGKQWYSPFDNRLYLFYHTTRPSGLRPLTTLCPSCAKTDVERAENHVEERKHDARAGPEWLDWCEQLQHDRRMEEEYWTQAQERIVREKGTPTPTTTENQTIRKTKVVKRKGKMSESLKSICILM